MSINNYHESRKTSENKSQNGGLLSDGLEATKTLT